MDVTFAIMQIGTNNQDGLLYPRSVINQWINKKNLIQIENALYVSAEEIHYPFIKESFICGEIKKLLVLGGVLLCADTILYDNDLNKEIFSKRISVETLCLVPKGRGTIKNKVILDDYELYGFNLIFKKDSNLAALNSNCI